MKIRIIRWYNLWSNEIFFASIKKKSERPYLPYADKKSYYMFKIAGLKIRQSMIVKGICKFTLRSDWVSRIKHRNHCNYKIETLSPKKHKVTRIF